MIHAHPTITALLDKLSSPLTLVDVGARGGVPPVWGELGDKVRLICFEADAKECERLNNQPQSNAVYIPCALAGHDLGVKVHITADPNCSSTYAPNRAVYENLPALGVLRPVRTINCPSTTLDQYCAQNGILDVDALKLDTQGSEYDILKGSVNALRSISFINIEVEFNELYEGQPLFGDVDRFLRGHGFVLWRLNHIALCSNGLVEDSTAYVQIDSIDGGTHQIIPQDNGQLFWGDAHYIRREFAPTEPNAKLDREQALKAAILIGQQGHWDLALEILRKSADPRLHAQLAAIVKPRSAPTAPIQDQLQDARDRLAEARAENERLRVLLARRRWFGWR
jgi:FkbM family methyltransferase